MNTLSLSSDSSSGSMLQKVLPKSRMIFEETIGEVEEQPRQFLSWQEKALKPLWIFLSLLLRLTSASESGWLFGLGPRFRFVGMLQSLMVSSKSKSSSTTEVVNSKLTQTGRVIEGQDEGRVMIYRRGITRTASGKKIRGGRLKKFCGPIKSWGLQEKKSKEIHPTVRYSNWRKGGILLRENFYPVYEGFGARMEILVEDQRGKSRTNRKLRDLHKVHLKILIERRQ